MTENDGQTEITSSLADYMRHLERHDQMWQRKASVRAVYRCWYAKIVSELSRHRPIIELGCGCGNFKQFCPEAVSTDVFATPWCEQVVDAQHMPFEDASVGNLVLVDVLHHVPTPLNVIGEANRVLTGGGRMIILEPYISLWSRFVYHQFHHESYNLSSDLIGNKEVLPSALSDYSNMATSNILFERCRAQLEPRLGDLKCVLQRHTSVLAYPLTGGFSSPSLIPGWAVAPLSRAEDVIFGALMPRWTAMRMFVVLEKQ